jgi:hypothetical protein
MTINLAARPDLDTWEAVDLEAQRTAAGEPCARCGAQGERHDQTGTVACPVAHLVADAWNLDPEGTAEAFGSFAAGAEEPELDLDDDQEPDPEEEARQEEHYRTSPHTPPGWLLIPCPSCTANVGQACKKNVKGGVAYTCATRSRRCAEMAERGEWPPGNPWPLEPDDENDEPARSEYQSRAGWVWACGCLATNGKGAHDPHTLIGFCVACCRAQGLPVARFRCGSPRGSNDCRCQEGPTTEKPPRFAPTRPADRRQLPLF